MSSVALKPSFKRLGVSAMSGGGASPVSVSKNISNVWALSIQHMKTHGYTQTGRCCSTQWTRRRPIEQSI